MLFYKKNPLLLIPKSPIFSGFDPFLAFNSQTKKHKLSTEHAQCIISAKNKLLSILNQPFMQSSCSRVVGQVCY